MLCTPDQDLNSINVTERFHPRVWPRVECTLVRSPKLNQSTFQVSLTILKIPAALSFPYGCGRDGGLKRNLRSLGIRRGPLARMSWRWHWRWIVPSLRCRWLGFLITVCCLWVEHRILRLARVASIPGSALRKLVVVTAGPWRVLSGEFGILSTA